MPCLYAVVHNLLCPVFVQQGQMVDSEAVFYWALAPLAVFYAVFAAVLLPNAAVIHPVALAEKYIHMMPDRSVALKVQHSISI